MSRRTTDARGATTGEQRREQRRSSVPRQPGGAALVSPWQCWCARTHACVCVRVCVCTLSPRRCSCARPHESAPPYRRAPAIRQEATYVGNESDLTQHLPSRRRQQVAWCGGWASDVAQRCGGAEVPGAEGPCGTRAPSGRRCLERDDLRLTSGARRACRPPSRARSCRRTYRAAAPNMMSHRWHCAPALNPCVASQARSGQLDPTQLKSMNRARVTKA